jgi:hypothetical protein
MLEDSCSSRRVVALVKQTIGGVEVLRHHTRAADSPRHMDVRRLRVGSQEAGMYFVAAADNQPAYKRIAHLVAGS